MNLRNELRIVRITLQSQSTSDPDRRAELYAIANGLGKMFLSHSLDTLTLLTFPSFSCMCCRHLNLSLHGHKSGLPGADIYTCHYLSQIRTAFFLFSSVMSITLVGTSLSCTSNILDFNSFFKVIVFSALYCITTTETWLTQ